MTTRVLSPSEVPTPEGAEGWEEMYPEWAVIGKDEEDENYIWFRDNLHCPEFTYPIDVLPGQAWDLTGSCGYGYAIFAIPSTYNSVGKYFYGRRYFRVVEVTDPKIIEERAKIFQERADFTIKNWDEIWKKWIEKCDKLLDEIEGIEWPELKLIEDWETAGPQLRLWNVEPRPSGLVLLQNWNKLKNLMYEMLYEHFSLHMLAFACYTLFRETCKKLFPDIEEDTIARMLQGTEQALMEGDFRLRELAKLAVELGIQDTIKQDKPPEEILKELEENDAGRKWLEKFEEAKYWLRVSTGNAFYHYHENWIYNLSIPFGFLKGYIRLIEEGKDIIIKREERAAEAVKLFEEYEALIPIEEDKKAFREVWENARKLSVWMEGHAYYNDHRLFSASFKKIKELGEFLHKYGMLKEPGDIRFLNWLEIEGVLVNLAQSCYATKPFVKDLHEKIEKRKKIIEVLKGYEPPVILVGKNASPPSQITDPRMIGLYGLTVEKIGQMLSPPTEMKVIKGWAASPGVYEGVAKVLSDPIGEEDKLEEGDILVTGFMHASQASLFRKIRALVTDGGGVMSHPAIVSREYGIPAVVGTAVATKVIKSGTRIRVDGTKGEVEILD